MLRYAPVLAVLYWHCMCLYFPECIFLRLSFGSFSQTKGCHSFSDLVRFRLITAWLTSLLINHYLCFFSFRRCAKQAALAAVHRDGAAAMHCSFVYACGDQICVCLLSICCPAISGCNSGQDKAGCKIPRRASLQLYFYSCNSFSV